MKCIHIQTVQPPFSFCQADIFGPILASQGEIQLKRWVLMVLCLSSHAVHLEILHHYSSQSITRGFRQTCALRGTPCIIWIDSGLNIIKAGKDLINTEMKVISALNIKFATIEFRVSLPKHYAGIGAVERIKGSIKDTVSKSLSGPHQLKMDDKELLTWIHQVIDRANNRPLILGAPLGITLTPNHVLPGVLRRRDQSRRLSSTPNLQVENHPQPLLFPLGAGIYQKKASYNLEGARTGPSGWRHCPFQE